MKTHQHRLLFDSEIIVDLFACGAYPAPTGCASGGEER